MRPPDAVQLTAAATLAAAALVAFVADRPPRTAAHPWRYPAIVIMLAVSNMVLAVMVTVRPAPVTGMTVLGNAVLLVYAGHRRARAAHTGDGERR